MTHKINPPFRADHVGSFLRPKEVLAARDQHKQGKLPAAELRKVEDEAIKGIIKFQEDLGVKAVTDGEFRRTFFHIDFLEQLSGVEMKGGMQVQFKTAAKTIEMTPPMLYVTGKVKHVKPIEVENFKFVKANTRKGTPKQTIPSPTMLHFRGGRGGIDKAAYPELDAFYDDVAKAYQTEIKLLGAAGCTYLQMDDTNLAYLCDPKMREGARQRGDDPNELPRRYAKLINAALEGKPANMAIGIHLCRGNFQSAWAAEGGYDPVAEVLFNEMKVVTYFLEYDDARSGGFAPLRFLPKGKTVVLGLVSSKVESLESKDEIKRRIEEAAKHAPLDQLCLSPQCGFSSTVHGNEIASDVQARKLRLVQDIAREVWGSVMKRSTAKILTTHVGSLPEPAGLHAATPDYEDRLKAAVADVVQRQRALGLDVINEGEFTKAGDWLSYMDTRFGGYSERPMVGAPLVAQGKDREEFADFYKYAGDKGTLFYSPGEQIKLRRPNWVCTGPVAYQGEAATSREIAILKSLVPVEDAFLTTTAPASLEVYRRNEFYKSEEEYVYAIAEAMRVEYEQVAKSGLILQIDDAWLPALWDRIGIKMGLDAFRKRCALRIEALNHALRNIPEAQVRYHLCWGSWHGPHAYDIEIKHLVDLMLQVKAQAYLIEGANARHEHEHALWESVKLPAGKILIPGVITHSTDVVEHPELVSQRLQRYAKLVGRENVMAGADCGFGGRSHPQIAWAKLKSLVEGAALASRALGFC